MTTTDGAPRATAPIAPFTPGFGRQVAIFAILLLCEFLYGWAWNTVDVLRPFIRQSLGLSLVQAGSAYSAQGMGALVGAVVIGQLADRYGRRRMFAMLVAGYGAMLLAGAWVGNHHRAHQHAHALRRIG